MVVRQILQENSVISKSDDTKNEGRLRYYRLISYRYKYGCQINSVRSKNDSTGSFKKEEDGLRVKVLVKV